MRINSTPERRESDMRTRLRGQRGAALLEAAISIPLLLLVAVGTFEFGRAFQTWQVVTNAAREGARVAVLPFSNNDDVEARVRAYLESGALTEAAATGVSVNRGATLNVNGTPVRASQVVVDYPFAFMVLQPVARLVQPGTDTGGPFTMRATALMRNEAQ